MVELHTVRTVDLQLLPAIRTCGAEVDFHRRGKPGAAPNFAARVTYAVEWSGNALDEVSVTLSY